MLAPKKKRKKKKPPAKRCRWVRDKRTKRKKKVCKPARRRRPAARRPAPAPIPKPQAGLPVPSAAIKTAMGQMGREMLLGGQRCHPHALLESGFEFLHPELESALRFQLGA